MAEREATASAIAAAPHGYGGVPTDDETGAIRATMLLRASANARDAYEANRAREETAERRQF